MAEEKRFYWIKLKTDFFDLPTIDWLQDQKNGCEYIVLYQKLCLLASNTNGSLVRKVGEMIIPYDVKKISEVTRFKYDTVIVAMELYKKIGLILEQNDGVFKIANFDSMVGSESKWAEKKRLQRDNGQDKKGDSVPKLSTSKLQEIKTSIEDKLEDNVLSTSENLSLNQTDTTRTLSDKRLEYRDKSIEIDSNTIKPLSSKHDDMQKIIDYLNQKLATQYKSTTKKTVSLIHARFAEGFVYQDFVTVIDKKIKEWLGTESQIYLRPETLFGTKFEGYLNQKEAVAYGRSEKYITANASPNNGGTDWNKFNG